MGKRRREDALYRGTRRLGDTLGVSDTERPILDRVPPGVPIIGPRENISTCQTQERGFAQVICEQPGLLRVPMPKGVHAELAQNQRAIAGKVMESENVVTENGSIVQIHIEGHEVEE